MGIPQLDGLSIMRLQPSKWTEYLKDSRHRLPADESECRKLQDLIVRERVLEQQVHSLQGSKHGPLHTAGIYFTDDRAPMLLYLCLGNPLGDATGPSVTGCWLPFFRQQPLLSNRRKP